MRNRLVNKQIWRGIEASQVGEIYKKLSKEVKELEDSQFVSWKDGTIKIKVSSSTQRQEIILKQKRILEELNKKGVKVGEMKIIF